MGHVAGVLENPPADVRDAVGEGLHAEFRRLVVAAGDQQRGGDDGVQPAFDRPVFHRADDVKLGRPVHGVVDCRVIDNRAVVAHDVIRFRFDAAYVAPVVDFRGFQIFGARGGARGFVAQQRRLHFGREILPQAVRLRHPGFHRGRELAMTSFLNPGGWRTACSAPSMPPQDWPRRS